MLDMTIWQKWSNVRSLSCWAFFAEHDMHMTVWMWMGIERHLCMYIYILYIYIMSFYYHGNGPNMEARPPTKNHASLPERLRVARLEQHNLGREIYRINSTDCFMWDFFLAGKSWALILSNLWKIQGLEISSEEFSNHQTCRLVENPDILYKSPVNTSILFWKKTQVSRPTIYNLPLEITQRYQNTPTATSELAMEIGFAQRQPCKKWIGGSLLGGYSPAH